MIRHDIFIRQIREYWQVLSVFVSMVVCLIYFIIESRIANAQVNELTIRNRDLEDRMRTMETDVKIMEVKFARIFETSPETFEYRLEAIEDELESKPWLRKR